MNTLPDVHCGVEEGRIFLWFPYNDTIKEHVRAIAGRTWNPERCMWSLPMSSGALLKAQFAAAHIRLIPEKQVPPNGRDAVKSMPRSPAVIQPGSLWAKKISFMRTGGDLKLSFPYDKNTVALIKNLPRRWFHTGTEKYWTIPEKDISLLKELLRAAQFTGILWDQDFYREEPLEDTKMHFKGQPREGTGAPKTAAEIEEERQRKEIADFEAAFSKTAVPDIDISDVHFRAVGGGVMEHQKDFMRFAKARLSEDPSGILVCDEQGLGKTLEAINLALYRRETEGVKHCLIVCCVNSNVRNWADEIALHTNGEEEAWVLGQKKRKDGTFSIGSSAQKLSDLQRLEDNEADFPFFLVTNVETLRMCRMEDPNDPEIKKRSRKRRSSKPAKPKKVFPIERQLVKLIKSGTIGMVVVDEVHKNTSAQAQQGRILWRIHRSTEGKCCWVPMTGTPLVNQPKDLFLPLGLAGGHDFPNFPSFRDHFCPADGRTIRQCRNLGELRLLLTDKMIRRTKNDALELPPKMQITEYVTNTPYQKKLYKETAEQIMADLNDPEKGIAELPNPLTALLRLRQVNGSPELVDPDLIVADPKYLQRNAKMKRLIELASEILENNEKAIVFSNWARPLDTVVHYLSELTDVALITGETADLDREQQKKRFQSDSSCGIICGTVGALGTGLTLTAATHIIFLDEPWTPAQKMQAEDRAHRIGTKSTVYIHTLIAENTVDERVHNVLYSKKQTADLIVDGHMEVGGKQIDFKSDPDLIRHLISGEDEDMQDEPA